MADDRKELSSRPVQIRTVKFNSAHAARLYRRNFSVAQANMYSMVLMNRVYKRNLLAERSTDAINSFFAETEDELKAEIKRYEHLCGEYSANPDDMTYSNTTEVQVEITMPQANRLLQILLTFDRLICFIDTLWFTGAMDDKQKVIQSRLWEDKVNKITSRIRNMYQHIRKALQISDKDQELTDTFRPVEPIDKNKEASAEKEKESDVLKTGTS